MSPKKIESNSSTAEREIVITRIVNAPRELVFEVMTDPNQVVKWWGPDGFTNTLHEMDVRPGGAWKHTMHGPDGMDYPNKSIFVEIVKPECIVYSHAGGNEEKGGASFQSTWTFEALPGNKTRITMHSLFPTVEAHNHVIKAYKAIEGGNQTLNRLEEYLSSKPGAHPFVIKRAFSASRELMWKMWTEPEHMKHWWGPKGAKTISQKLDFRVGGTNHYGMSHPNMGEMWGKFVYREIVKPERFVFVNSFSNEKAELMRHPMNPSWPLELLTTITFVEEAGKTTVTIQWLPLNASQEEWKAFDAGRASMKQGWGGSLDTLTEYLTRKV